MRGLNALMTAVSGIMVCVAGFTGTDLHWAFGTAVMLMLFRLALTYLLEETYP